MKEFRVTERQMVEAPTQINSIAEAHLLYGVPREMNSMYRDPMTGDLVFYKGKVVKTAVAQVSANGSFLFAHVKNRKKLNHPDFQWDDKKLKKQKVSIFDLYRGWSLGAAIKDIWNARIDHLKHNLYPDWIKKQFTNLKEK